MTEEWELGDLFMHRCLIVVPTAKVLLVGIICVLPVGTILVRPGEHVFSLLEEQRSKGYLEILSHANPQRL